MDPGRALCFGGSPETRWVRNLQRDGRVSVNLGSETEAVILEGTVELITDADHPLSAASAAATKAKYPQYYEGDEPQEFRPFGCLRPELAYAWTLAGFATTPTRWDFRR